MKKYTQKLNQEPNQAKPNHEQNEKLNRYNYDTCQTPV